MNIRLFGKHLGEDSTKKAIILMYIDYIGTNEPTMEDLFEKVLTNEAPTQSVRDKWDYAKTGLVDLDLIKSYPCGETKYLGLTPNGKQFVSDLDNILSKNKELCSDIRWGIGVSKSYNKEYVLSLFGIEPGTYGNN